MATQADVRRIALALPGTQEPPNYFAFEVPNKGKMKGYAWVWMERVDPKKPRVANAKVLAVRVTNLGQKDLMISAEPTKFFTEPHYNGFPAVLVRLAAVSVAELRALLKDAWRCMAPADASSGAGRGGGATKEAAAKRTATKSATKRTATKSAAKVKRR